MPQPPTPEQQAILDVIRENRARVILVEAGPGSGKTWVFVEAFRHFLDTWNDPLRGIAAISFTNVAKEQIEERIGRSVGGPHFIDTLDSFLLRFVVRPFAHVVGATSKGLRLIPDPIHRTLPAAQLLFGTQQHQRATIFNATFMGGTESSPTLTVPDNYERRLVLSPQHATSFLAEKKREWAGRGRITHSDSHYLAACILTHPTYGRTIAELIARRFSVILVDELQDTDHFLGRAILELLKIAQVKALLVGDQDQGIFEFSGADPAALSLAVKQLPGVLVLPLRTTRRCSKKVSSVASFLSVTGSQVVPKEGAPNGRAILLVHSLTAVGPEASLVRDLHRICGSTETAILARRNDVLNKLLGPTTEQDYAGSLKGRAILTAVDLLHTGQAKKAAALVSRVLGELILDESTATRELLRQRGIEGTAWRTAVHKVLIASAQAIDGVRTWNQWLAVVRSTVEGVARGFGQTESLHPSFRSDGTNGGRVLALDNLVAQPELWARSFVFKNVHRVKGDEFKQVVFFVPKTTVAGCPSVEWFAPTTSEERRIAFVAASRAVELIVICVHKSTFERLRRQQPSFVSECEVIIVGNDRASANVAAAN